MQRNLLALQFILYRWPYLARAKRPLPEGEWKSLEIGSQFISFIQVHDWLIAVKFQRDFEEAIKSAAKVCSKVRIKSSRLA